MTPELEHVLRQPSWTFDEAAWIFTGFSIGYDGMELVRLADGEMIVFGSQDYRNALKEHDRILVLITKSPFSSVMRNIRSSMTEGEIDKKKAAYKKDVLIDLVANKLNHYERVHVPWLDDAWNLGLIRGYIVGKDDVVDSSAVSMTSSVSVHAEAEVVPPTKQFEVSLLTKALKNDFFQWVYDDLVRHSLAGSERPKPTDMISNMKNSSPHYIKHDKTEIFYWKDAATKDEECSWAINSLKSFIGYHTTPHTQINFSER
jgi:hypothetical protein